MTSEKLKAARTLIAIELSLMSVVINNLRFKEEENEQYMIKLKGYTVFLGKEWYELSSTSHRVSVLLIACIQACLEHPKIATELAGKLDRSIFSLASQYVASLVCTKSGMLNSFKIPESLSLINETLDKITSDLQVVNIITVYNFLMDSKIELPMPECLVEPGDIDEINKENDVVIAINSIDKQDSQRGTLSKNIRREIQNHSVKIKRNNWDDLVRRRLRSVFYDGEVEDEVPDRYFLAEIIDYFEYDTKSRNKPKRVGWIIDTSGSMQDEIISKLMRIATKAQKEYNCECIVMSADSEVKSVSKLKRSKDLTKVPLIGGGGTDFRPALKEMEKYNPSIVFYLTDSFGVFPQECPYDVVWIFSCVPGTECTPPFGTVLYCHHL